MGAGVGPAVLGLTWVEQAPEDWEVLRNLRLQAAWGLVRHVGRRLREGPYERYVEALLSLEAAGKVLRATHAAEVPLKR